MRQQNNITDHTSEVDRDHDRVRAQEEVWEGGLCAPVLTNPSPFRVKYSGNERVLLDYEEGVKTVGKRMNRGYVTVRLLHFLPFCLRQIRLYTQKPKRLQPKSVVVPRG